MGFLDGMLYGAIGYGVSEMSKSHPLRDAIDHKMNAHKRSKSIRDVVEEYAEDHGIYTQDNDFAHELHKLATQYEEYDYYRYY